jgi:starch synthase (maltosyl-transferring)
VSTASPAPPCYVIDFSTASLLDFSAEILRSCQFTRTRLSVFAPLSNLPPFSPFIFYHDPLAGGISLAKLDEQLKRAAELGFNFFMATEDDDVDSRLKLAKSHSLELLLECSLSHAGLHSGLFAQHPEWLQSDLVFANDLPDPRRPLSSTRYSALRWEDPGIFDSALGWWITTLCSLTQRGVSGFVLRIDGELPASFFKDVMSAVRGAAPGCKFIAWAVGIPAHRVSALDGAGFDCAVSSSAWWDFRSPWLVEEAKRLAPFGCTIATTSKRGERMSLSKAPSHVRSLWLAAATGDGLMVSNDLLEAANPELVKKILTRMSANSAEVEVSPRRWQLLSSPGAASAVLLADCQLQDGLWALAANAGANAVSVDMAGLLARAGALAVKAEIAPNKWEDSFPDGEQAIFKLGPHDTYVCEVERLRPMVLGSKESRRTVEAAAKQAAKRPRIAIESISPSVDAGRFRVKRCIGDTVVVEADIFGEGHDRLAAALYWRGADQKNWQEVTMRLVVNDRWQAQFLLPKVGTFEYQLEAWLDIFGAYRNEIEKKDAAGQQVGLELREGVLMLDAAAERAESAGSDELAKNLHAHVSAVAGQSVQSAQVARMLSPELHKLMIDADQRLFSVRTEALAVDSERRAAGFSSWYELFPRSMGPDSETHGKFADVLARLPAIREMGFDTLYFPPIHPIGSTHRKGRNNSLEAGKDDPGSPYAIGAADGGHDAIHHELGTLDDFRSLQSAVRSHGMELALDFAIQCSPDHPWLKEHPRWFSWRPDGTIRYAENPPKKYQDIVNVDFYAAEAVPQLWVALRGIVLFWVKEGVHVFRVDNPHTKPMPFWEWLIGDVRSRHPEVIFLAEAFTRPKPMYRLAKVGFSQSYTYFTWRHTKQEFIDYLSELSQEAPREFFRPHFFVNTPDINPYFLQRSGRAGFVIRAALAATLSGLWGVYSGFELCEAEPVPGKEEYLDSEKYELRQRDWTQPGNIVREITLLNGIRRSNPALQTHLGVRFCKSTGENILCFTKTFSGNVLFVAICLDPHAAQECQFELPLEDWKVPEDTRTNCEDLTYGNTFSLQGRHQKLRIDPADMPFLIWRLDISGVN